MQLAARTAARVPLRRLHLHLGDLLLVKCVLLETTAVAAELSQLTNLEPLAAEAIDVVR